jgi:hypothetical protein
MSFCGSVSQGDCVCVCAGRLYRCHWSPVCDAPGVVDLGCEPRSPGWLRMRGRPCFSYRLLQLSCWMMFSSDQAELLAAT